MSAFQVGCVSGGGTSTIGWATSTDGGQTWTHGFRPGATAHTSGPYGQVSDASVAYNAKDNVWMISYLDVLSSGTIDGYGRGSGVSDSSLTGSLLDG